MCSILLHRSLPFLHSNINSEKGRGGWVRVKIPRDKPTVCRWIGSHFHDCIDFYGIAFSDIFNRFSRMELHIC